MKKPSEIFEEHIDSLIEYLVRLKNNSEDLSLDIENCNDERDIEALRVMKKIYNEIFDDLALIIKETMKEAFESKIKANNISDNLLNNE
jgi:hypothetical protein